MINTTKFTNGVQARYDELLRDPVKWGIMKNLAYASIRDDVEKIVKHTNKNSADTFINADNLIQNLKSHNINQYIEAGTLTQNINLSDTAQLNQILMNSDVIQVINRQEVIKTVDSMIKSDLTLFFNNPYALIAYFPNERQKYINASFSSLDKLQLYVKDDILKKYLITADSPNVERKKNGNNTYKTVHYNYKQVNLIDSKVNFLIYRLTYDTSKKIIMILVNLSNFKIQNPIKDNSILNNNLFGSVIGDREKLGKFLGHDIDPIIYSRNVGLITKTTQSLKDRTVLPYGNDKLFNMNN